MLAINGSAWAPKLTNNNMNTIKNKTFKIAIILLSTSLLGLAEKQDITPDDPGIIRTHTTPTVIEKFTSLRRAYSAKDLNWSEVYNEQVAKKDPDEVSDVKVHIPMLLGMRITDGVVTVMGRDAEQLDDAAVDIEKLAKKLNVSAGALMRAKKVKAFAKRGEWNRVYMELGFLQQDVMRTLNSSKHKGRRVLLISAGWMQGAHIVSGVLKDNYKAEKSTLLREPMLLTSLIKDMNNLDAEKKNNPMAKELLKAMKEILVIVDIPVTGSISKADIEKVHLITSRLRGVVLK